MSVGGQPEGGPERSRLSRRERRQVLQAASEIYGSDAYAPEQIAKKVEQIGVRKARAPFLKTFMLGVLAGGFIGLGGLYYTFLTAYPNTGGPVLAGVVFAAGYIMAILAGAEVFTSNNLLAMTWASGKITTWEVVRNWSIVLAANAVGAVGLGLLFLLSGLATEHDGALARRAIDIAEAKVGLAFHESFFRGILGNLFVCLAVWISLAGRTVTDKILGALLPLSALAAVGLEHIVASLYYLPRALLLPWVAPEFGPAVAAAGVTWSSMFLNFIPVTLGNIFGGSLMVALVYYVIYIGPIRPARRRNMPGKLP